jgi:hypothetical protein
MSRALTAVSSSCRAWRKIDSFSLLLAHDNLFSYDHSPRLTVLLITYPSSVLFGMVPITVQICRHVATLTYDKNILLPFNLFTPHTSLFGREHQTNVPGSTLATLSDVDCADSSLISAVELTRGRTDAGGFLKFCYLSPCEFVRVTRLWEEGYSRRGEPWLWLGRSKRLVPIDQPAWMWCVRG